MLTALLLVYTLSLTLIYLSYKTTKTIKLLDFIKNFSFIEIVNNHHPLHQQINNQNVEQVNTKQKTIDDVPGPIALPLVGTKWIFYCKYKMSKLHEVYKDFHKIYGPVVVERTPTGFPIVSLFKREDIEQVLRYKSKYPFRPPTEITAFYRRSRPDRYASVGIVNTQGEDWYHLRVSLTSGFNSRQMLNTFLPALDNICDDFVQLIKNKRTPDGIIEDFQEVTNLMGLETVCCLILGRRLGCLSPEFQSSKFNLLAIAVKRLFILTRDAYFGGDMWKYIPTKTYKDFVATEKVIYDIVSEIVDESIQNGYLDCETDDIQSIYRSILQTDLDIREKKTAIMDFIQAGIETLANTVAFLLYYLTEDPEYQDRIYNEFCNATGELTQETLAYGHFTKACIQESYRMCPTAFCLARVLEEDQILSGYHLKAGTVTLCQTGIACQDDANFEDAHKFKPERWLDCNQNVMSVINAGPGGSLVLPFGSGRRMCPGKKYTEIQLSVVVIKLIQAFKVEYIGPLETVFEFLIAPKGPVRIRFTDRT